MSRTNVSSFHKYVAELNALMIRLGATPMSTMQQKFVSFCIRHMTLLGCLNFSAFAVASLGCYQGRALSWMLHHSKLDWSLLLKAAVVKVLRDHKVSSVHIAIDDTDRKRSKVIKALWGVFKTIDKATGGWTNAQNIVFICLITDKVTFPILFTFYRPDPKHSLWAKNDKKLREKKVSKKDRPAEPTRSLKYPTRLEIAINLLQRASLFFANIESILGRPLKVKSIVFDSAYMSPAVARFCRITFKKVQVISQIAKSQIVWDRKGIKKNVNDYFQNKSPIQTEVNSRGSKIKVRYLAARLTVKSHGVRLTVIALKYEGETEYRYLAATELTWRGLDIIRAYALRWLIEVVNFDWKQHDGWGKKAFQRGADGACRGVILSLLVDCFLLTHPAQLDQSREGQPLWTAGSIVMRIQHDDIINTVEEILTNPDPEKALKAFANNIENVVQLRQSTKHMVKVEISDLGPSASLLRMRA